MFKKNDYALLAARILLICNFLIGIIICPIIGIWLAVKIHWGWFFITFPMLLAVCVFWIIGRLFLSFFCDIKLIRNKLYENDNEKLDVFLKPHKKSIHLNDNFTESVNSDSEQNEHSLPKEEIPNNELKEGYEDSSDNDNADEENCKKSANKITKATIITIAVAFVVAVTVISVVLFINFYNSYF